MDRPTPFRRVALAGLSLLLVVGVAACGARNSLVGHAPAATVNGHEITQEEVTAFAKQQQIYLKLYGPIAVKNGKAQQSDIDASLARYQSSNPNSLPVAVLSDALTVLVQQHIYAEAVKDAGEKLPTEAQVKAKTKEVAAGLKAEGGPSTSLFPLVVENEARVTLMSDILKGAKKQTDAQREAQLRAAYKDQVAQYTQVCLNLIVTNTQAEADAAKSRVQGGESFASVAKEVSADPTTAAAGGDAGCVAVAQVATLFGPGLADAKPGALFGPAPSQGQFLVVQVNSYKVPTFEELRSQLESSVPAGDLTASRKALAKTLRTVKVHVDPRYGTFNRRTASVTPPKDARAATTTTERPSTTEPATGTGG